MMKRLIVTFVSLATLVGWAADSRKPQLSAEERRDRIYRHTGGMVTRPAVGKRFKIVNAAGVDGKTINRLVDDIGAAVRFPVTVEEGTDNPRKAVDDKTGFALLIVRGDGPRILTAPEDRWARVDISTLVTDDAEVLDARIRKEVWRALVYGLGGGNTKFPRCVMKPLDKLAELDANKSTMACPEVYTTISETAVKFGIRPNFPTSYLRACQEGWAPEPTNDVQKAIWDKVHAMPVEPLKIKPESKKVRE